MASWNEAYAICPFYVSDEDKKGGVHTIYCEALFKGAKNIRHSFVNKDEKRSHLDNYCNCYNYYNCPFYKSLMVYKFN